jgi:hypothetical protein
MINNIEKTIYMKHSHNSNLRLHMESECCFYVNEILPNILKNITFMELSDFTYYKNHAYKRYMNKLIYIY